MELKAWGDESILTHATPYPIYMLGVCICSLDEDSVRKTLDLIKPAHASKLHWRAITESQQKQSCSMLQHLPLQNVIVSISMSGLTRTERARRKCFEVLLPILENEYEIKVLTMESRERHQDIRDLKMIDGLRSRKFINDLHINFVPGANDARLWLPDQMLGIYNTQNATDKVRNSSFPIDYRSAGFCS
ncbi:hypothetical protein OZX73_03790 [Bifidobacterium sp. ESL0775]|uniref:hypothetical protein n=1 Tax=Bifidobacterium sp. ESL0775 TaxID=2983230 RepID=UPI0023F8BC39|nr:hypothetical protein [Bifidobacterium sp. ESL0775]WEV69990.1 hypothetical protein OZX73_03790 [Bifidobacterium sp. ESL0775]